MAFKTSNKEIRVAENPVDLFRSLSRRQFQTEMPHQRAILEEYVKEAADKNDVALQLPTGSGKTLVGLLIAEWRRRRFDERVVYLCPTRQLVHQTLSQADSKYGLDAVGFTRSAANYSPRDATSYRNGDKVAITSYSSLFNTNPFFDDADTIIVDDAHAAENYIASMWSLEVDAQNDSHKPLHAALSGALRPHLSKLDYSRLIGEWDSSSDATWVDKIPSPVLWHLADEITAIFEAHTSSTKLAYTWSLLKDHILACHLYVGSSGIVLRPLVPPTWSHHAFENASHRIYMSATLGEGGDLERLTGRENIFRVPVPAGFELQGVGRRFFMFPGMSMEKGRCDSLRLKLIEKAGRAVVLTPSQKSSEAICNQIEEKLSHEVFSAEDIEESKVAFTESDNAVAVMAGRYDGIDFPQNECRFLCVDGLPRAMNLQERFLMSKMGAGVIFHERIQTRILQAIGRCTRALQDFSAVYVTGAELQDYLADRKRRKYFYPELQAELDFGVNQSIEMNEDDFIENFETFLENDDEWASVNDEIISSAKTKIREFFPAKQELADVVASEVRFQKALWSQDFAGAFAEAKNILAGLKSPELRGYRALWHYLAGSAAFLASKHGQTSLSAAVRDQFSQAKNATPTLPWLVHLSKEQGSSNTADKTDHDLTHQIERLEQFLCNLGTTHEGAYTRFEKKILAGLNKPETFEQAHCNLGKLLGFDAGKEESDASPDPWWIGMSSCIVFEDHAGAKKTSKLGAEKARQVAGHPEWMRDNIPEASDLDIIPILISPVSKAEKGALPHLKTVYLWPLEEFQTWAENALSIIRSLRSTLAGPGDIVWRAEAYSILSANDLSMNIILERLKDSIARDKLK